MKTIKLLYDEGYDLFCRDINDDDTESVIPEEITFLEMYLEMYPEVTKLDILEIIEYVFLVHFNYPYISEKSESDETRACEKKSVNSVFYDYIFTYPALCIP